MDKEFRHYIFALLLRLAFSFSLAIFPGIFYAVFKPLTLGWSYFFFSMFVPSALIGSRIATQLDTFSFVPACTAASAYLLLALLILLTKDIDWKKRIYMFLLGSTAIFGFNLLRIELLLFLFMKYNSSFPLVHMLFWKFISTVFVFALWLILIRHFSVKSIPAYSDLAYIWKRIRQKE